MHWKRFFTEDHREERRRKLKRNRLADIFWYSSCYDYRLVRVCYNFPIGVCLGMTVYQFGWSRLNFADFHPVYSALFQWTLILGTALAFALSPVSQL